MLSSSIYRRKQITAKHSSTAHQPRTKQQSKSAPSRARERKPAGKVGESKHDIEPLNSLLLSSHNDKTNEGIEIRPAHAQNVFAEALV